MNVRSSARLLWLPLLFLVAAPAAADWQVWTVAETRRVLREELPHAQEGMAVKLAAARNEWESFQILIRSDEPVRGVRVEPGELRGPKGAVLPAAAARLYRQHALHLTEPTFRNDQFRPGWYPDPLIPFVHRSPGKPLAGARFTAVPFDLPAGEAHGFWVDLYVPANAQPGEYRGTYRVVAGAKACQVPVTLTVWDFQLPATPTLQTALGSPAGRMKSYYQKRARAKKESEPADWKAVELQCAEMLSEHRINATPWTDFRPVLQPDGSFRIPAEQVRAVREFIDRYHVNAIQVAHPRTAVKDPVEQRDKLHAWLAAWDRAAKELDRPQVTLLTYLRDEPNDEEEYHYVQKWGRAIRAAKSAVKVLVVEQTKTQNPKWGDLYGAIDIWCPLFPLHDPETAAQRLALGEKIWTYTALCQTRTRRPGGRPISRCSTTVCRRGWPGNTACAACCMGAGGRSGAGSPTPGPIPRRSTAARTAKGRYITAKDASSTRAARQDMRESLPACDSRPCATRSKTTSTWRSSIDRARATRPERSCSR